MKSQNEDLNIGINKLNNQYLKSSSKIASIKQIQLNLHREQDGVFDQLNALHDSAKTELAQSYTKSYELIDKLNKDKQAYEDDLDHINTQRNIISDLKKNIIGLEIETMKAHQSFERNDITSAEDILENY
jgi:hypothetical protein